MEHYAAMLNAGGRLAITVPNPWYIVPIFCVDSADHVAWYDTRVELRVAARL